MAGHPLEDYLRKLRDIRDSGSAVPETFYYPALAGLLDAVGATLKPKVRCIVHPSHGAGIPDIGLFTADQFQKTSAEEPQPGTKPARGVIEVKPTSDDVLITADGAQVSKFTNWAAASIFGRALFRHEDKEGARRCLPDQRAHRMGTAGWVKAADAAGIS